MSEELQAKIDEVVARYKPELDRLEAEGGQLGQDAQDPGTVEAVINVDFDMTWKDQVIIADLPTVTMRERALSLDLPRVEMNAKRIVFHTPSVRMENRCLTKIPHLHGTTVKWKCVYTKVPVVFMQEQEIIYDLPSVTMERKDFSLKIPEFSMRPQRISLKIPEFTARDIKVEAKKLEEKGEDLRRRGEEIGRRMKSEVDALVASLFGPMTTEGIALRETISNEYNDALGQVNAAIGELAGRQIDPGKVPAEGGNVNLRRMAADLVTKRDETIAQINAELPADPEDEKEAQPIAA